MEGVTYHDLDFFGFMRKVDGQLEDSFRAQLASGPLIAQYASSCSEEENLSYIRRFLLLPPLLGRPRLWLHDLDQQQCVSSLQRLGFLVNKISFL